MLYNDVLGEKISSLGLGCMRLPTKNGKEAEIDVEKSKEMFELAISSGINYFDTAWDYHKGNSESVTGEILSAYPRESFCLASKFPGYNIENIKKKEEIFEEQLRRCRVDYFDFYLFHCITDGNIDTYLTEEHDLYGYVKALKESGKVRHVGFSVHASIETTRRFLEKYGDIIEFIQIQLNYLDLTYQDAQAKIELARERNIPIWVMEPLRGGKLASLSKEYMNMLSKHRDMSAVEWAFRFVQSIPEVKLTLSGMSTLEQLQDNIRIFSLSKPLSESELKTLDEISRDMQSNRLLPCTKCQYCVSCCPLELNIPYLLRLYNEHTFTGGEFTVPP
ncbi:MAG: aldo/keto reductase, partial [Clostridia bacterium]|nr:aldo/keto reductase [Clostridia bacterium]